MNKAQKNNRNALENKSIRCSKSIAVAAVMMVSSLTGCEAFDERSDESVAENNASMQPAVDNANNNMATNQRADNMSTMERDPNADTNTNLSGELDQPGEQDFMTLDNVKPVSYASVNVIAENLFCGTASYMPLVSHYVNNDSARGLLQYSFPNTRQYTDKMILVEGGQRPTGGFGFSIKPQATIIGDTLILKGQWTAPAKDAMVMQTVSSPCVLIEAPAGSYTQIQLLGEYDDLVANTTVGALPAPRLKKSFIDPTMK